MLACMSTSVLVSYQSCNKSKWKSRGTNNAQCSQMTLHLCAAWPEFISYLAVVLSECFCDLWMIASVASAHSDVTRIEASWPLCRSEKPEQLVYVCRHQVHLGVLSQWSCYHVSKSIRCIANVFGRHAYCRVWIIDRLPAWMDEECWQPSH